MFEELPDNPTRQSTDQYDCVIVGGGFSGLAAAWQLARAGHRVCVLEQDSHAGGLASDFAFSDAVRVEKFYHHWFNSDHHIQGLIRALGLSDRVITLPTKTGVFFNGRIWKLSAPLDLLRFSEIPFLDRLRLGIAVLRVRWLQDWRSIEHLSIREWLEPLCGKTAYQVIWEPLVSAKFSEFAERVSAVWMWKKLVLRGGTRNRKGGEQLLYFKGGFGQLANEVVADIRAHGGTVIFDSPATGIRTDGAEVEAVCSGDMTYRGRTFLFTPAFPVIADMFTGHTDPDWIATLRRVNYLGNICLILRLNRSLMDTYWLNVNDPGFPFVGVIEHTNFSPPANYAGSKLVYLSRYISTRHDDWALSDDEYVQLALDHLKRIFPDFDEGWIEDHVVWRANYAQPVTELNYSTYVPGRSTPFDNALISTMAHVYPEDRGTNYAVREGLSAADWAAVHLNSSVADSR